MHEDYDVVVVGANGAGLIEALSIATLSNQNIRTLVMDRNPVQELGKKSPKGWPCGDATSERSIDYLKKNLEISYGSDVYEHRVKRVACYSPDRETELAFEGPGVMLNRKLWPQALQKDAIERGVDFRYQSLVEKLIIKDDKVVGVEGKDKLSNSPFRVYSKVVVDAAGMSSPLKGDLPDPGKKSFIEKTINAENDVVGIERYIMTFDQAREDKSYFDPDSAIIHFDPENAPGGYKWPFPKGPNKVNIGIGVSNKLLKRRNQIMNRNDDLHQLTQNYVREFEKNIAKGKMRLSEEPGDSGNVQGIWSASVRRHNDCLVWNGYLIVGDAAWMPRAVDAGGISNGAIYAPIISSKTIVKAIEGNDVSMEGLWKYNWEYNRFVGHDAASWEVLRRLMQLLSNKDLNYGMKHFVRKEDISKVVERQHPDFRGVNPWNPLVWPWILGNPKLAMDLRFAVRKSKSLGWLYHDFPESPKEYPSWHRQLTDELDEAYRKFPI